MALLSVSLFAAYIRDKNSAGISIQFNVCEIFFAAVPEVPHPVSITFPVHRKRALFTCSSCSPDRLFSSFDEGGYSDFDLKRRKVF